MTSLNYGLDMPYEVQLQHDAAISNTYMAILEPQRTPGAHATQHFLTPGVYMVSLSYNGSQAATLRHLIGGVSTNMVRVPEGTAGSPRTSAPIKISVQGTNEYLNVDSPPTGGSARATISVIPAATFDEMAESAQGVSVLSEISNLKSTKADKSTLDARVPANTSLRLDTSVGARIFAGNTMIHGDTGVRTIASWDANGVVTGDLPPQLIPTPGFMGSYRIGRRGSIVSIYIERANIAVIGEVMLLPSGFRPGSNLMNHTQAIVYADGTPGRVRISSSGISFADEGKTLGERIGVGPQPAKIQFDTVSSWPATLPGLPA